MNIIKDEVPSKTVENIKSILKQYNINVYDKMINPCPFVYSHIIGVEGLCVTHAGKGISEELSLASAYAELIERLSNHMFGKSVFSNYFFNKNKDFIFFPDTYKKDISEISFINSYVLNSIKNEFYLSDGCYPSDEDLVNVWGKVLNNELHMSPFYNVKDDKIEYMPSNIIDVLCGPNGIAAGNTYEEAIVHCICEIIERYVLFNYIISNNSFSFPEIPINYIKKNSKTAFKIINQINQKDRYNIRIYDISMNGKFPCCGVVLIDTQTQHCRFRLGCHPIFSIAIERCLSEMMQEYYSLEDALSKQVEWNRRTENMVNSYRNRCGIFRHSIGFIPNTFFKKEKDFLFKEWDNQDDYTTKKWSKRLINLCIDLFGNVYIRNNSWFGFPVIRMYIPKATEITIFPKGYKNNYDDEIFYILKEISYFSKCLTIQDKKELLSLLIQDDNIFISCIADKEYVVASLYYELGYIKEAYNKLCEISNPNCKIKIIKRELELTIDGYSLEDRDILLSMFFDKHLFSFLKNRWRTNTFINAFNNKTKSDYEIEQQRIDVVNFIISLKEKILFNNVNQFIFRDVLL